MRKLLFEFKKARKISFKIVTESIKKAKCRIYALEKCDLNPAVCRIMASKMVPTLNEPYNPMLQ